jgi:hypothetical protein
MLATPVIKDVTVSGSTATFTLSDGSTKSVQVGTDGITSITADMITDALGYVPVNKAGDTMTGRLLVASGTAAQPGITFDEDLVKDTGFHWVADGVIGVSIGGQRQITFGQPTNGMTVNGNISGLSDERVKTNIVRIDNAMARITELLGCTYDRTDVEGLRQTGLIAQHVQKVLPEAVSEDADGKLSLAYGNLAGLFVEAFKELHEEIHILRKEVATLKGE